MAEENSGKVIENLSPKDSRLEKLKRVATSEFMYDHATEAMPTLFDEINGATEDFVAGKMNQSEFALFSSQAATLVDKTCVFLVKWKAEYEGKVQPARDLARENREKAVSLTMPLTKKA